MTPRVWAELDPQALRHNLAQLRARVGSARIMAVIKANGYGHGAVWAARCLRELRGPGQDDRRAPWEADAFAVACLEEALALRAARVQAPMIVLEGVLSMEEARVCLREKLEVVVHDHWQLALMEQLPRGAEARIWIKIDSGMRRLGFPLGSVPAVLERLKARPEWKLCGAMTHLASADEDTDSALMQAQRFDAALGGTQLPRSIANSAGVLADHSLHRDWVRPGLMIYGMSPRADQDAATLGLRPVMTLYSRVLAIRDCAVGDAVGYGGTHVCQAPTRVATVAVGYADGFQRALSNCGSMLLHGQRVPVIGRVSMDMTAIDVTALPAAAVGDDVTLWGEGLPAEEQAKAAGTLAYELCAGLTQRVHLQSRVAADDRAMSSEAVARY
ncbi:MAG: alanine racemase [Algiphilus sp.]